MSLRNARCSDKDNECELVAVAGYGLDDTCLVFSGAARWRWSLYINECESVAVAGYGLDETGSVTVRGTNISSCWYIYFTHLPQRCHNSKFVIFQEKLLKVLKSYNFLWVQRRHNCSPAASFANCVMTLHLLKVHLQTFLSIPMTQKCQILSCDTLVANERYYHWDTAAVLCRLFSWG